MSELFEEIRSLRSRTASDIPQIVSLVSSAFCEIIALKPKSVPITHLGREYFILECRVGSTFRRTRPCRQDLVDLDQVLFKKNTRQAFRGTWAPNLALSLERFVYTSQQILSCYLDIFHPSAARKVVGTVFESLMACALNRASNLSVGSGTVKIPKTGATIRLDLGIRRGKTLVLLVATKTSTRERLSQPFVQKYIVDRALENPPKSILVVIGDVQRVGDANVQHTFTAGQFKLYWEYLTPMDGVYYIDVPPQAETEKFGGHVKRLNELFSSDLRGMILEGGN